MINQFHHHLRSPLKRGIASLVLVAGVMTVGTIGFRLIEGLSWMDAFYFMSMIATAQGPTHEPATAAGKLFTSFMAFTSVGTVVAALGFLFGPFFGLLFRSGADKIEHGRKQ